MMTTESSTRVNSLAKVRPKFALRWVASTVIDRLQVTGNINPSFKFLGNPEHRGDYGSEGEQASSIMSLPPETQPQTINVILFGETGVGNGSIVNLIARENIAEVSSDINSCTMQYQRYPISFDNMDFAIFDTIGLEKPQIGVNGYLKAIEMAYELISRLGAAGGIHLLLFCMHGSRITATTQSNYRLFCECLCNTKVPIALVFTGPEKEEKMENWWDRNKTHIETYGIKGDSHACVTAILDDTPGEEHKFEESQVTIRRLLKTHALKGEAFSLESYSWFTGFARRMKGFIRDKKSLRKKHILMVLVNRCKLDADTAKRIAEMMDKSDTEGKDAEDGIIKNLLVNDTSQGEEHTLTVPNVAMSGGEEVTLAGGPPQELGSINAVPSVGANGGKDGVKKVAEDILETALKDTISKLRSELAAAKQKEGGLDETINSLRADLGVQNARSMDLEKTVKELRIQLSEITQQFNTELASSKQVIHAHRQKHVCQTLYANGHVIGAAKSLLDITKSTNDDVKSDVIIMDWLPGFMSKCHAALEHIGDVASQTRKDDEALAAYAAALSLCPSNTLLNKWVSTMLLHGSTNEILDDSCKFELPEFAVYCAMCDVLEGDGRVIEAIGCFGQMRNKPAKPAGVGNERARWEVDFLRRCVEGLEKLAEAASSSQNHAEAEKLYSSILSLDPPDRTSTLIKRSHTRAMMRSWEDALKDADEVIKLEPSSHLGYEKRHAALHGARRHAEAVTAFDTMLSKLQPPARRSRYPNARRTIMTIMRATISRTPQVLIDTTTGHLYNRTRRAKVFEALPIFYELVSSMTREIDDAWIRKEVNEFCGYVMLSHKWEHDEPLFQKVMHVTVYKLEPSRENLKLQTFCSIVRSFGFRWAWSDTCCIDKSDNVVLQESLVAMFPWYRNSSLTIIHLLGVSSLSEELSEEPDDLRESIWNSRVWTYQEYVAAKRVLFYTEDWKPYRGLTLENHKESPIILRQMEMPQVSSEQVAVLQPGLDRVREKLYLASTRETTLVEDIAYSLLGVLNARIPIIYGEGTCAVGRLLEYVLTGSGDATILAWTGPANDYNSCLPLNLTVYKTVAPPHVPHMETAELNCAVTALRSSILDHYPALALYDELNKLASPTLSSSRLRLPGILSCVKGVDTSGQDGQTYRATTDLFGNIEVKTASNLTLMRGLCLVHPWIRPLLDQEFNRGSTRFDSTTQALRLVVRLRQPFGALLFEQVSRTEYKRVAADSLIVVRFCEEVSLTDLVNNIRTIEIL